MDNGQYVYFPPEETCVNRLGFACLRTVSGFDITGVTNKQDILSSTTYPINSYCDCLALCIANNQTCVSYVSPAKSCSPISGLCPRVGLQFLAFGVAAIMLWGYVKSLNPNEGLTGQVTNLSAGYAWYKLIGPGLSRQHNARLFVSYHQGCMCI